MIPDVCFFFQRGNHATEIVVIQIQIQILFITTVSMTITIHKCKGQKSNQFQQRGFLYRQVKSLTLIELFTP